MSFLRAAWEKQSKACPENPAPGVPAVDVPNVVGRRQRWIDTYHPCMVPANQPRLRPCFRLVPGSSSIAGTAAVWCRECPAEITELPSGPIFRLHASYACLSMRMLACPLVSIVGGRAGSSREDCDGFLQLIFFFFHLLHCARSLMQLPTSEILAEPAVLTPLSCPLVPAPPP